MLLEYRWTSETAGETAIESYLSSDSLSYSILSHYYSSSSFEESEDSEGESDQESAVIKLYLYEPELSDSPSLTDYNVSESGSRLASHTVFPRTVAALE